MNYNDFIEKYGDVEVVFSNYYKYSFTFKNDSENIIVGLGGSSEDIYRLEVNANEKSKIKELGVSWAQTNDSFIDFRY